MEKYPEVQAWVNNSAVVLLSGLLSVVVTIWVGGSREGSRDAQIRINTVRLDTIEKYGSQGAREEIIKLHDTDTSVDRHLQDIDRRLAQIEEQNAQQTEQIAELRRVAAGRIR
jgi:hypothetical protein